MRRPSLPRGAGIYDDRGLYRARLGKKFTGGKDILRTFASRKDAEDWIFEEKAKMAARDAEAKKLPLTVAQAAEAHEAFRRLEGRATLTQAVDAWEKYVARFSTVPTVTEAIDQLVLQKAEENQSPRHRREIRAKLTRFFGAIGILALPVNELTPDLIRAGLKQPMKGRQGPEAPSVTQRVKRLRYVSILTTFATKKGWIGPNPVLDITPPKPNRQAGEESPRDFFQILSPTQTAKLLFAAEEHFPEMKAALAIKIFSGVRNKELIRLKWQNVRLAPSSSDRSNQIVVLAAFSKTGRRRVVSVHRTLYHWLTPEVGQPDKSVFSMYPKIKDRDAAWLKALSTLRKKAGIDPWPQNCLRHGFGSYHYALHQNEALTAKEIGDSIGVVRRHYVDAVLEADCNLFWSLVRGSVEGKSSPIEGKFDSSMPDEEYIPPPFEDEPE